MGSVITGNGLQQSVSGSDRLSESNCYARLETIAVMKLGGIVESATVDHERIIPGTDRVVDVVATFFEDALAQRSETRLGLQRPTELTYWYCLDQSQSTADQTESNDSEKS